MRQPLLKPALLTVLAFSLGGLRSFRLDAG